MVYWKWVVGWGTGTAFVLVGCAGVQSRYYQAQSHDSLPQIANRFHVPLADLVDANTDVVTPLRPGTPLYIPFESSPDWLAQDYDEEADTGSHSESASRQAASMSKPELPYPYPEAPLFSWPVMGRLSSRFGMRWHRMHRGIDIAASEGTPVRAARSGHVLYAGHRIRGYGRMVILRHADSFSTIYAHLSALHVRKGQFVSRGALVGLVGHTGHAHGSHLHFEIRESRRNSAVNPLFYLQSRYASNILKKR